MQRFMGTRGAGGLAFLTVAAGVLGGPALARGQSVGYGASPGRAAYRPPGQWNNGPYYTAPHIDPYAPHRGGAVNLYASEPIAPPYSTRPHGLYGPFYPGQGTLHPYVQGFSPYSNYAPWYRATYGVTETRESVLQGRDAFFRSAPRPPASVLPPLPPAQPVVLSPSSAPVARESEPGLAPVAPGGGGGVRVYRSSVAGAR